MTYSTLLRVIVSGTEAMRGFSKIFVFLFFLLIGASLLFGSDRNYKFFQREKLSEVVEKSLGEEKGDYGIVIKNLKTEESYALNSRKVFQSASLYKLWVMATVYEEIKDGNLKESDVLSSTIPELNTQFNLSSEEAELTEGAIERTVADAVFQMITFSHNYSALLLSSEVGNSRVSSVVQGLGLNESRMGTSSEPPQTTASDIALFFELLYKGEIVDKNSSQKMMNILLEQELNDRIPKFLPKGTKVAHKTGELFGFKHDAGIVFTGKGDYIIVALLETNSPAKAAEKMANLSKAVYDYFER